MFLFMFIFCFFLCFRLLDSIFPFSCRRGHPGSAVVSLFFIHAVTVSAWHICNGYGVSLLCNHWQFLLGISAMAKPNQTNQKNKKNDKTQLSATTSPLGCAILFFFWFFGFLVFCFLVSCFLVRCWWFEGLAKQYKSEGPRPNSLPVIPL